MHRFRKKSETRPSGQTPSPDSLVDAPDGQESLPQLPLSDDFRTSLILPDLSRRFSLLRSPSGDPFPLEGLRTKFAQQRARGEANQVSQEEEDMLLETLRGIKFKGSGPPSKSSEDPSAGDDPSLRQSIQSTSTLNSSLTSSPSPSNRSAKRYSNNLFSSGRFRDYSYIRSVTSNRTNSKTLSLTPTESSNSLRPSASDGQRPVTPEGSGLSSSVQSSPSEKASSTTSQGDNGPEYRISKRMSLALQQAIKEIEEEADDEVVMPRSTPIPRGKHEQDNRASDITRASVASNASSVFEAGMAISSDRQIASNPDDRRASPVPSRILPGYIPGMPRPMTPRDLDLEDQRSHSTTPRATSPLAPTFAAEAPSSSASNLLRRDSASSASKPPTSTPTSPLFLNRSTNGRFTPDASKREPAVEFDSPSNSTLITRRRPASPLAGPPFQSIAMSSSRPGTPSNIVWTVNTQSKDQTSGHRRNESWNSDGMASSDVHGAMGLNHSGARTLRSPALPESPTVGSMPSNLGSSLDSGQVVENRPSSKMSMVDLSTPPRPPRSATPTANVANSPTSPTFSDNGFPSKNGAKRSSKQNHSSSLFNLGIPPLVFSPLTNSSRSSLESEGSSYHTWEEDKDRSLSLFTEADDQHPAWHEISSSEKSSSATPGGSADDDWDPEEIISRYAGLKKSDFMAIQDRLVNVAKESAETRDRAQSSMRRRRPSTSQSNYSVGNRDARVASPTPQAQPPPSPGVPLSPKSEQYQKANALLNSMIDSIEAARTQPVAVNTSDPPPSSRSRDISPTTRRNRDLAQILFGYQEVDVKSAAPESNLDTPPPPAVQVTNDAEQKASPPTSPYLMPRNPSTPKIPQTPGEAAELAREVQQKNAAATLALKKAAAGPRSPNDPYATISRKRINPNQISNPRLVSSSSSVDAVPIPRAPSLSAANISGPSKIGSRFKKLRGTLRAKHPLPTGTEITPYPLDPHSPPSVQTVSYDPAKLKVPGGPTTSSANETSRFKFPVPSPPASAGPGLKGFMARFRNKQRLTHDGSSDSDLRNSPQPATVASPHVETSQSHLRPVPRVAESTSNLPVAKETAVQSAAVSPTSSDKPAVKDSDETAALKQLFDAANNLGLDQEALNDLLARSASSSSRANGWAQISRSNSSARQLPRATSPADSFRLSPLPQRQSIDGRAPRVETPDYKIDNSGRREGNQNAPVSRQSSVRKQPEAARRPREHDAQGESRVASTVVRRTLIFPSDAKSSSVDLNAIIKKAANRGRRGSVASISGRSVHDRVPTPPPPKSPTAKRFSSGPSPPVPQLPPALATQADSLLAVPSTSAGGPIENSNSAYDSLYEMYAGENRTAGSAAHDPNAPDASYSRNDGQLAESGPALELVELANGETIWSIVNGLRDDDEGSLYTRRASLTSEYSTREEGDGGLQIFVKEHARSGSKGSNSSFMSRKKSAQGKPRPDTKVFYTSSAHIGRFIESLSQGMDAGSFNILPNRGRGHSVSSSMSTNDMHWTVEERLEHMLGTINRPS